MSAGKDDACVHHLFEAQVAKTPFAVAVIDGDRRLTYRELDERATVLARVLRGSGVALETAVGVCCEPSADTIVALLAILKAGGAYVPLDPASPRARIELIVADARIPIVLTETAVADRLQGLGARCICVDAIDALDAAHAPSASLASEVTPAHAMHILYTSGSTGAPKGVVGLHRATVNRLRWADDTYPYSEGEICCARTTLGFVDSVAELFAPLAFGVPLVVLGAEARRDLPRMVRELAAASVTRIALVPSVLSTLLEIHPDLGERLPLLRYWFVSGEPMPLPLAELFERRMPGRKLVNLYGSTEVAGDATYFDFDRLAAGAVRSPIGTPLRGVHARIVDGVLAEVEGGEVGEICISGACVAREYLNLPDLTAARFVANPFAEGGVLFRTGDLGRRLETGDLEYIGRSDRQVKIRGMRVELDEVEAIFALLPGIREAVAVAQTDGHDRRTLVAFYTADRAVPAIDVRAHFECRVPDYMIPSRFVALEALPRKPNGKIDRDALSHAKHAAFALTPPGTESERRVAAAWEAVLECGPVGRTQSFYDVGGNSLAAIRIVARLRDELAVTLPVQSIFAHPTIAALGTYLDALAPAATTAHAAMVVSGSSISPVIPLTHYQLPFWVFTALTGGVAVVSDVFGLTEAIDLERLQEAYSDTVATFDALWMSFSRWSPVQAIRPRRPSRFSVVDHRTSKGADVLQAEADANSTLPFDLEKPPHVRARLVRLPGGDDRLLVAMPHVVGDMTAMGLFLRVLERRYAGSAPSTRKTASLEDLVRSEREPRPEALDADAQYWANLAHGPAWNAMPARLFTTKLAGRSARALSSRALSLELTEGLETYSRDHAVTVPMALIGAIYAALVRTAENDELTLLLMLDKRAHDHTRDLFSNMTSLMRFGVPGSGAGTLDELVARLGTQLTTSYGHTDHQVRRPTLFNDFWTTTPRAVRGLVGTLSASLAERWPHARLEPNVLAEYVFALVPYPAGAVGKAWMRLTGRPQKTREILIAVNVLPEVYEPREGKGFERRREFAMLVKPGDLMINTDLLLDTTLQIHVTRNEQGLLVSNLYGGGMDQTALDEISERILEILKTVAGGRGSTRVL